MTSKKYPFYGKHILGELYEVDHKLLQDIDLLTEIIKEAIPKGNATLIKNYSQQFHPEGSTILCMLAESHIAIHIYPSKGCMFIDIFTCGNCSPSHIFNFFTKKINPGRIISQQIVRGNLYECSYNKEG